MSTPSTIVGLGARTDHIAASPHAEALRARLTPDEAALLGVVGRVARIDDVLARARLPEPQAIAVLLSLRAKGAVVPARVTRPAAPAEHVDAASAEEVDLEPERKAEILALERRLDTADHFALLGLEPGADAATAKKAFYELSRKYHPDRFYGKNLGSFRNRLDRIFRKLSEAHAVLSDAGKRDAYLKAHPDLAERRRVALTPAPVSLDPADQALAQERAAERRSRLARHPYLARAAKVNDALAQGRKLVEQGDYERAYQDLNLVLQLDPTNREATQLLQEARRRHDAGRAARELARGRELEARGDLPAALAAYKLASGLDGQNPDAAVLHAVAARKLGVPPDEQRTLAQRAVDLAPNRARAHALLAQVLLDAGAKKLAKRHFEEALKLEPDHADAKAQLKKLRWTF